MTINVSDTAVKVARIVGWAALGLVFLFDTLICILVAIRASESFH